MEYAYRMRDALVELTPGEVGIWRLPPMTRGFINIKTYYSMPPGWVPGGGSARSTRVNPLGAARDAAAVELGAAIDIGGGAGGGTIARDSRPWQPGGLGPDLEIGDFGGSFGETMELTLELLRVGTPVAIGLNHIFHETPNAGDIWALKVTRKVDGSVDRRRYRIHVQYPSVLPLETRRVPTGFLNRGFDANWNDNPYLAWFQLRDNVLSYKWNVDFAALYGLPPDNQHIPLGTDRLKLPTINSINLSLAAGGGQIRCLRSSRARSSATCRFSRSASIARTKVRETSRSTCPARIRRSRCPIRSGSSRVSTSRQATARSPTTRKSSRRCWRC